MANINTYRKAVLEAIENYEEAREVFNKAADNANKAWTAYREFKNKRNKTK